MALEISADHPNFPKGFELDIPGVGAVPNGGSITVGSDAEDMYATMHQGRSLKDDLGNSGTFKVKEVNDKKKGEGVSESA